jgi:hypothetical protein
MGRECGVSLVVAMKDGERGRNRTFNLLIKSYVTEVAAKCENRQL